MKNRRGLIYSRILPFFLGLLCFSMARSWAHGEKVLDINFIQGGTHTATMLQDNLLTIYGGWESAATPMDRLTDAGFAVNKDNGDWLAFGGKNESNEALGTLWKKPTGGSWTEMNPSTSPSVRYGHELIWIGSHSYLLFGGFNDNDVAINDTWIYSSTANDWTPIPTPSSPTPRGFYSLSFDSTRAELVLYGGRDESGLAPDNYTWIFSVAGTSWTRVSASPNPGLLGGGMMAFHDAENKHIFFGGRGSSWTEGQLSDKTWAFDPLTQTWTDRNAAQSPEPLVKGSLIFDPNFNQMIAYGGLFSATSFNEHLYFYSYASNKWSELILPATPAGREGHKMRYDPFISGGVFLGGRRNSYSNLTWSYSISSTGTWTSNVVSVPGSSPIDWSGVSFTFEDPYVSSAPASGAQVLLQISSSTDGIAWSSFSGPSGSTASAFVLIDSSPIDLSDLYDNARYLKIKATLSSQDFPNRPKFSEISFSYNQAPTAPALKTPSDNAILNFSQSTFTWNLAADNDGVNDQPLLYHIQFDNDSDFSSPSVSTNGISKNDFDVQYYLETPLYSATWYWRVRAKDNHDLYGDWSNPFTLYVDTHSPPGAVTGLTAETGGQRGEILLTWTFPGDDDGRLDNGYVWARLSTQAAINDETAWGAAPIERKALFSANPGESVQTTLSGLSDATTYYVVIKTIDEVGNVSELSTVSPSTNTQSPPSPVTSLSLSKGPGANQVSVTWTFPGQDSGPLTGGTFYLRASTTGPIATETDWDNGSPVGSGSFSANPGESLISIATGLAYGTSYYFSIKTEDPYGQISAPSLISPQIHSNGRPFAVTSLSVTKGSLNGTLSLSWTFPGDYEGALTGGTVLVRASSENAISNDSLWDAASIARSFALNAAPGESQVNVLTGLSDAVTYYVAIKILDEFAASSDLSTNSPGSLTNGAPWVVLTAPNDGSTLLNPQPIQWNAADPNAGDQIKFDLFLSVSGGSNYEITLASGLPHGTTEYLWNVSSLPKGTRYRIQVKARDELDLFSIDKNDANVIRNVAPTPPSVIFSSGPTSTSTLKGWVPLHWAALNKSSYTLYSFDLSLSTDNGSTYQSVYAGGATFYLLNSNLFPNGSLNRLKLVVQDAGDPPGTGMTLTERFSIFNPLPPGSINLIYPIEDHYPTSFDMTFSWGAATGTIKAYKVEISTQSNLADATTLSAGVERSLQPPSGLLQFGSQYYWRVIAVDADNQEGFSRTASFSYSKSRANTRDGFMMAEAVSGLPDNGRLLFEDVAVTNPELINLGKTYAKGDRLITPFDLPIWKIKAVDEDGQVLSDANPTFRIEFSFEKAQERLAAQTATVQPHLLRIGRLDETTGKWTLVENQNATASASTNYAGLIQGTGVFSVVGAPVSAAPLSGLTNFPNPFSPNKESTRIRYVLTDNVTVTVRIFNLFGDLVRELVFDAGQPGGQGSSVGVTNEITWDGRNQFNAVVANGVYLAVIEANGEEKIRRIGVLK